MKKNKGFTLIELLGVLVILVTLLAIAIPTVSNIIDSSRKKAFAEDARSVINVIKRKMLTDRNFDIMGLSIDNFGTTLNINDNNYQAVRAYLEGDDIYIYIAGQNTWHGLSAYGTINNIVVDDTPPIKYQVEAIPYQYVTATKKLIVTEDYEEGHDGHGRINLNFAVNFGGEEYTEIYPTTNGIITFSSYVEYAWYCSNDDMRNALDMKMISVMWDSYYLVPEVSPESGIYYDFGVENGKKYVVVEYRDIFSWQQEMTIEHSGDFEVKIFEDGTINMYFKDVEFNDPDIDFGKSATVGVYSSLDNFAQYLYNEPLLTNESAISFKPEPLLPEPTTYTLATENCFNFNTSTRTITRYNSTGTTCPLKVEIPSTLYGYPVENIGSFAFYYYKPTGVKIPEGVKTIGSNAFRGAPLKSVVFPDSLTYIGDSAFTGAEIYGELKLSKNLVEVAPWAFHGNNIKSLIIPASLTTIGKYSFENNELTDLTIPDTVTSIGEYAFAFNKLTNLKIGNGITYFEGAIFNGNFLPDDKAFIYARNADGSIDNTTVMSYGGAKRENVIIPNGIKTIGESSFEINLLSSVTIPNSVTTIGDYAFSTNVLEEIIIPDSVTTIGQSAFYANLLTYVDIPDSVTSMGIYAFDYNNLTSFDYSKNLPYIPQRAFSVNHFTSVTIPNTVTDIHDSAFEFNKISNLVLHDGITNIDKDAFGSNLLTSVNIPSSLTSVNGFASNQITSVTIPNTVTTIEAYAFDFNQIASLTIPSSVVNLCGFTGNKLTSVTIPNTVTTILDGGTFNNNLLTSVVIPSSVTYIGSGAFSGNPLTSVSIPNTVTAIGSQAFLNLPNLTSITLPTSLKTIGSQAFYNSGLTSVTIPEGVTSIGDYAFYQNQLTSVTLPSTLTSLGGYSFCKNKITGITIPPNITALSNGVFQSNLLSSLYIPNNITSVGSYTFYQNPNLTSVDIDRASGSITFGTNAFDSAVTKNFLR